MGSVTDIEAGGRLIADQGTPESVWAAWDTLARLPRFVPESGRVVVVAPHPDDEVIGCGGLLSMLARQGRDIVLVSVTDGEASHPPTPARPSAALAEIRHAERAAGWRSLAIDRAVQHRVRVPDGRVGGQRRRLAALLDSVLRPGDQVFATWRLDGHPDHEATGEVAADCCARAGCRLVEMPVWMWHWARPGDPRVPWDLLRRVDLDAVARARKHDALAAHRSQLEAGHGGEPAILPPWALARMLRPFETFFVSPR